MKRLLAYLFIVLGLGLVVSVNAEITKNPKTTTGFVVVAGIFFLILWLNGVF